MPKKERRDAPWLSTPEEWKSRIVTSQEQLDRDELRSKILLDEYISDDHFTPTRKIKGATPSAELIEPTEDMIEARRRREIMQTDKSMQNLIKKGAVPSIQSYTPLAVPTVESSLLDSLVTSIKSIFKKEK